MKLARYSYGGEVRIAKIMAGKIVDIGDALPGIGGSMRALLERLDTLREAIDKVDGPSMQLTEVTLEAPIDDPQKYIAIGMNYKAHAEEAIAAGQPAVTSQAWFNKQVSCITGPYHPIDLPRVSDRLDYEGELAYVIGKRCRRVKAADALGVIAGYMIANDVSVRDWQQRSPTVTLGKSFDTHGPIGPWLTLADEVPDPQALELKTFVNGELRQQSSTGDMIYDIPAQIEYLSTVMTLYPGDIIITGTPPGVGIARGKFLKVGDVVRIEIDRLGHIENMVEPEPG